MIISMQRVLLAIHNKKEFASNGAGSNGQVPATTTSRSGASDQPRNNGNDPAVMPADMWRDSAETHHKLVGAIGMGVEWPCLVHQATLRSSHHHNSTGWCRY